MGQWLSGTGGERLKHELIYKIFRTIIIRVAGITSEINTPKRLNIHLKIFQIRSKK